MLGQKRPCHLRESNRKASRDAVSSAAQQATCLRTVWRDGTGMVRRNRAGMGKRHEWSNQSLRKQFRATVILVFRSTQLAALGDRRAGISQNNLPGRHCCGGTGQFSGTVATSCSCKAPYMQVIVYSAHASRLILPRYTEDRLDTDLHIAVCVVRP